MKTAVLTFSVVILLIYFRLHTSQDEFDSNKWKETLDGFYPKRKNIIKSLLDKKVLIQKNETEVFRMLGIPDYSDSTDTAYLIHFYQVQESYGFDIDPQYSSTLKILMQKEAKLVKEVKFVKTDDRRSLLEKILTQN